MKRRRFLQYPGGVQDPNTSGRSSLLTGEELNTLSYLVRKYPKEAMEHLSSIEMLDEINSRGRFNTDNWIIKECLKKGIIKISEEGALCLKSTALLM